MFKNLLQFWKGKDFLQQVLEDFKGILDDTESMFHTVCKKLIRNEDVPNLKNTIYSMDNKVNDVVKDIRKRVMGHLSIQPSVDLHVSLLLISVVKDAERIGDFSKNLMEVSQLLDKPVDKEKFSKWFGSIEEEICDLFQKAKKAFLESDEEQATQSWTFEREIVTRCDKIIENLAHSDLSVNEAVCYTLMARYFKRVSAHLTNIATSVVLPISDLDYFDEKRMF
ncbi:PhoU domain-containing protein [candidate division KSB1 bacterium]